MLQLSLDGKRLYVTNSLFSSWDNQFYPEIGKQRLATCCRSTATRTRAGWQINKKFMVDFGNEPDGPARRTRFGSRTGIRRRIFGSRTRGILG